MSNQPHALTKAEWEEIGTIDAIRQSWGVEDGEDFAQFGADNIYAAKFDFHSGSPGYVGDLYLLQGDALTDHPPFLLTRDKLGKLVVADLS
jgi:hypothetical protein